MHRKTKLHIQVEQNLGLLIYKIENKNDLDQHLNGGLARLYQAVFKDPPYNEYFSEKEIKDFFHDYLAQKGHIFVAVNDQDKTPVAFVVSVPLKADFDVASKTKKYANVNNDRYLAEDGVDGSCRRNGVSSKLKHLVLEAASISGAKSMILRTSQYNYRQISAVNKTGGVVIAGLFQDVSNKRMSGEVVYDRRVFYKYSLGKAGMKPYESLKLNRVIIARPGGNDTAFVFDDIPRERQGALSMEIQKSYSGIEQVMFVEKGTLLPVHGQMAGGEFCGNATRSLGFIMAEGKNGTVSLEVSNGNTPVRADVVIQDGYAKTSVPLRHDLGSISKDASTGEYIVDMGGISFFVTKPDQVIGKMINNLATVDEKKALVKKILDKKGLTKNHAAGLLIMTETGENSCRLDPFVFVRDTGSLYYETGCGSGSTAIGAIQSWEKGTSISDYEVMQPSGMSLYVSIERKPNGFGRAFVNGAVEILSDGSLYISSDIKKTSSSPKSRLVKKGMG